MYHIDVLTYHWDNDHFDYEDKTISFSHIDAARKAQKMLRGFEYSEDELLQHWSVPARYKDKPTHDIPLGGWGNWVYERLGIYHGVIIQSDFDIYVEKITREIVT